MPTCRRPPLRFRFAVPLLCFSALVAPAAAEPPVAGGGLAPDAELRYDAPFFPGADHDPAIPTPEELLGFPIGARATTPEEISRCLEAWARTSPRALLLELARSWEGRPLHYLVIAAPAQLERLGEIRDGWGRVADPRGVAAGEAERLAATLPAVAWLGYSIHGDETSGADAALALAHHLAADRGAETAALLDELVVIVQPTMNPDGRARFLKQLAERRGARPNLDDQSLHHTGDTPSGRGNHYLFDLNRDWIFGVQPETRGQLLAVRRWHPLLFVDGHEMEAQETFLFYPPREPINPYLPDHVERWWRVFGADQAAAFDRRGWRYYTGEWAEEWHPGYAGSWGSYRGAVGILYEQAGISEDGVRHPQGTVTSYRRSVHHQLVSSLANLRTFHAHHREIARDFLAARRRAVSEDGPFAGRTFAVLPGTDRSRLRRFAELAELLGFELLELPEAGTPGGSSVESAVGALGVEEGPVTLPAGTLLLPNRQPEAHLLAATVDLDLQLPEEVLRRERRKLLRDGGTLLYDLSAWSLPLLYGLEALQLDGPPPAGAVPYSPSAETATADGATAGGATADAVAWIVGSDGGDAAVSAAVRLMELGLAVRVADRAGELGGQRFDRGAVAVTADDNRGRRAEIPELVRRVAGGLELSSAAVRTGMGAGELPDLGGRHFVLLEPPRVALVGRGRVEPTDFGALWYTLDRELGLGHSHLDEADLGDVDLRRYNVVVLPDRHPGGLPPSALEALAPWVEAGGTLIAVGGAAGELARAEGLGRVRQPPEAFDHLDDFRLALLREWAIGDDEPDPERVWARRVPASPAAWPSFGDAGPDPEELRRRDRWQRLFMPHGVLLAGRLDGAHWLTTGCRQPLPLLAGDVPVVSAGMPVLLPPDGVEAPVRLGVPADAGPFSAAPPEGAGWDLGWAPMPPGRGLALRIAGLLWPEAARRLANAAYLTRERVGHGQLLLFAAPPAFRGTTLGTRRLFWNAVVLGPGFGAEAPIR